MSTAPTGFQTPKTNWQSADVVLPDDLNRIEGNINAIEAGNRTIDQAQVPTGLVGTLRQFLDWIPGAIRRLLGTTNWYDTPPTTLAAAKSHIDAAAPHSGHETPSGAQAKVDAAMASHTGAADPHPNYALDTDLSNHAAATAVHGATSAATANRIILRDSAGRAKIAAPAASDDIAQKAQVDAVQTNLNNHISAADPHSQYALDSDLSAHKTAATLDHPDGSVTLAKINSAAMTSAGGTEANRLAVTNASGRVGDADKVDGLDAASISGAKIITLLAPDYQYRTSSSTSGNTVAEAQDSYGAAGTNLQVFRFLWQAALAAGRSVYFEAIIAAQTGYTAYAGLKNLSTGTVLAQVSTTNTSPTRLRSGALSLPDNTELAVCFWNSGGWSYLTAARLIII